MGVPHRDLSVQKVRVSGRSEACGPWAGMEPTRRGRGPGCLCHSEWEVPTGARVEVPGVRPSRGREALVEGVTGEAAQKAVETPEHLGRVGWALRSGVSPGFGVLTASVTSLQGPGHRGQRRLGGR